MSLNTYIHPSNDIIDPSLNVIIILQLTIRRDDLERIVCHAGVENGVSSSRTDA